jgi:hypothetical protein
MAEAHPVSLGRIRSMRRRCLNRRSLRRIRLLLRLRLRSLLLRTGIGIGIAIGDAIAWY